MTAYERVDMGDIFVGGTLIIPVEAVRLTFKPFEDTQVWDFFWSDKKRGIFSYNRETRHAGSIYLEDEMLNKRLSLEDVYSRLEDGGWVSPLRNGVWVRE